LAAVARPSELGLHRRVTDRRDGAANAATAGGALNREPDGIANGWLAERVSALVLRSDSLPLSSSRTALCTSRSRIASASVASPIASC
jgi:hypothetical protein